MGGPITLAPACSMLQDGGCACTCGGGAPLRAPPLHSGWTAEDASPLPACSTAREPGRDTRRRREECAYALEAQHLARGLGLKSEHVSQCVGSY